MRSGTLKTSCGVTPAPEKRLLEQGKRRELDDNSISCDQALDKLL